jgi:hypothetical protein
VTTVSISSSVNPSTRSRAPLLTVGNQVHVRVDEARQYGGLREFDDLPVRSEVRDSVLDIVSEYSDVRRRSIGQEGWLWATPPGWTLRLGRCTGGSAVEQYSLDPHVTLMAVYLLLAVIEVALGPPRGRASQGGVRCLIGSRRALASGSAQESSGCSSHRQPVSGSCRTSRGPNSDAAEPCWASSQNSVHSTTRVRMR